MERRLLLAVLILLTYVFLIKEPICIEAGGGLTSVMAEIREPANGAFVRGVINITVELGGYELHKADLHIDKEKVKTWDSTGVHRFSWNTTALTDGSHTIRLIAYDRVGGSEEVYVEVVVDNTPPSLSIPIWSPREPSSRDDVIVSINATDETSGVLNVTLYFSSARHWDWNVVRMTLEKGVWRAMIPRRSSGIIDFRIVAYDAAGNRASTKTYTYTIRAEAQGLPAAYIIIAVLLAASLTLAVAYLTKLRKPRLYVAM